MTFVSERIIKAVRKARQCNGCLKTVEVGERAIGWAGLTDGDFGTATYHFDCREAEIALNRLRDTGFYDEWTQLHDVDPEERDWLITEHPAAAARMGITAGETA